MSHMIGVFLLFSAAAMNFRFFMFKFKYLRLLSRVRWWTKIVAVMLSLKIPFYLSKTFISFYCVELESANYLLPIGQNWCSCSYMAPKLRLCFTFSNCWGKEIKGYDKWKSWEIQVLVPINKVLWDHRLSYLFLYYLGQFPYYNDKIE